MKRCIYIMGMITCVMLNGASAQTPYDAFAPEASRPILELVSNPANDTVLDPALVSPVTDDIRKWSSVDPLTDKYPGISPYAYCHWNPIRYIDPDGMDWYEEDGQIKWTDCKSQQEMISLSIDGHYLGEAYVEFRGSNNEQWGTDYTLTGDGANPATVTIYGINNSTDIQTYKGMTIPQNESFPMLNTGDYKMFYEDMATSVYGKKGAIAKGIPIANTYRIQLPNGEKMLEGVRNELPTTMTGVFMHRTNWDGRANSSSKGCLIIDARSWRDVEMQLQQSSNIYLRVYR